MEDYLWEWQALAVLVAIANITNYSNIPTVIAQSAVHLQHGTGVGVIIIAQRAALLVVHHEVIGCQLCNRSLIERIGYIEVGIFFERQRATCTGVVALSET